MTGPDDCGVTDTNDPRVCVLWGRQAATVRLVFAVEPEEQRGHSELPPTARAQDP